MIRVILVKSCANCGRLFEKPPSCSRKAWAVRPCCSIKCGAEFRRGRPNPRAGDYWRGRKLSDDEIAKRIDGLRRSRAKNGTGGVGKGNLGRRGPQTSQWKGDDIAYRAAHARLYVQRGRPERCESCGTRDGRIEWALRRDAEIMKVEGSKRFSPRPSDYFPLCCRCHNAYDRRQRDPRTGHFI